MSQGCRRTWTGIASLLVWLSLLAIANADLILQQPPSPTKSKPAGTIRGRVINASSGAPLRHASVAVTSSDRIILRALATDDHGFFECADLPAAGYFVRAAAPGFVTLESGEDSADLTGGQILTVNDGDLIDKVTVALPPAGVITGRVLDEGKVPLDGVPVIAMMIEHVGGRRVLQPPTSAPRVTDDRGRYRLFGLQPGEYYVVATPGAIGAGAVGQHRGYDVTYYPGSSELSRAELVQVAAAQESQAADLYLVPADSVTLAGVVVTTRGAPAASVELVLMPSATILSPLMARTTSGPNGVFEFSNIAAGTYVLQALPGSEPDSGFESSVLTATGDLKGIVVRLRQPVVSRAAIVFESGEPNFKPQDLEITMRATDYGKSPIARGGRAKVRADWAVEINGVWGPNILQINRPPKGWIFKSVRAGTRDVTGAALDFDRAEALENLEIVISNRVGTLSGTVVDHRGGVCRDSPVLVVAESAPAWSPNGRSAEMVLTDERGRFVVSGLPPGQYWAVAPDRVKLGEWWSPAFIESVRASAERFTIGEAEARTVDLRMMSRTGTP